MFPQFNFLYIFAVFFFHLCLCPPLLRLCPPNKPLSSLRARLACRVPACMFTPLPPDVSSILLVCALFFVLYFCLCPFSLLRLCPANKPLSSLRARLPARVPACMFTPLPPDTRPRVAYYPTTNRLQKPLDSYVDTQTDTDTGTQTNRHSYTHRHTAESGLLPPHQRTAKTTVTHGFIRWHTDRHRRRDTDKQTQL